ncbi:MAG: DUF2752 domain-containing protein [Acutalibacteraceae bacterium]
MKKRAKNVLILFGIIIAVGIIYIIFNSLTGIGIPCVFHLITGLNCPGCGVSRMIISLINLDFEAAFRYNAALFVLSPVFLILAITIIVRYIKTGSQKLSRGQSAVVITLIVLLLLFGIVRNLPFVDFIN